MLFCSANFEESRVTHGLSSLEICLSDTHASGNREAQTNRSFISSNIDSRCKGDNGKGMKVGHQEGTQKTKGEESPLCCIDGHPPHSKVRVHRKINLECGHKYEYIPGIFARAVSSVEIKFKLRQSSTKWLTVVTYGKLRG